MTNRRVVRAALLLSLPTLIVGAVVVALMWWRVPTRIAMALTVDRLVFSVAGDELTPVLTSLPFRSVTVEKPATVKFTPARLALFDPSRQVEERSGFPEPDWWPLDVEDPILITGAFDDPALQPSLTFEGIGASPSGTLDRVWAEPGADIVLELRGGRARDLTLLADQANVHGNLSFSGPFELIASYCRFDGVNGLSEPSQDERVLRASLRSDSPLVEFRGKPRSLVLNLSLVEESEVIPLPAGGILVAEVDFTRQGAMGERETTLAEAGEIRYPDHPDEVVPIEKCHFVTLDRLEKLRLDAIALDSTRVGMQVSLSGSADVIETGPPGFQEDRRLTYFHGLWNNPDLRILFGILIWVFPTTLGAYNLYKELREEKRRS
jgi:hypothetical protein